MKKHICIRVFLCAALFLSLAACLALPAFAEVLSM